MTYRGTIHHGVVVLEGSPPPDGTVVTVTPADEPAAQPSASHPAAGIWKDRADLPEDVVAASAALCGRMMRRDDERRDQ